jgi:hypothetical protein
MRRLLLRSGALGALVVSASVGTVSAQKVDLPKCERPSEETEITSFAVVLPLPPERAHSRVVRAFVEVGILPTEAGKLSNAVEWDSGTNDSGLGVRRRVVRATVFEDDDGNSKVIVTPIEYSVAWGEQKTKSLSNYNDGYGFKVWCAAKAVTDSLTSASDRIRARQAGYAPASPTTRDTVPASSE